MRDRPLPNQRSFPAIGDRGASITFDFDREGKGYRALQGTGGAQEAQEPDSHRACCLTQ